MISRLEFRAKKPYSEIDEKIKYLVDAMNATGVMTTVASCHGHASGKPPYVYFKASVDTASSIERLLREAAIADDARFRHAWVVEGRFNEKFELTFLLYSPAYHEMYSSFLAFIYLGVFRKRLDAELLSLARVVEQAVLPNIGNKHKPHITTHSNNNGNSN